MYGKILGLLFGLIILPAFTVAGQSVTDAPDMNAAMTQKWAWSMEQIAADRSDTWVVFSFERLMCEHCHVGTFYSDDSRSRATLGEVLLGQKPESVSVRSAARRAIDHIDGTDEQMVIKSMVVLIQYQDGAVADVDVSNLSSHFDFDSNPIIWLGSASATESFEVFEDLYSIRLPVDAQKGIVWATGSLKAPELSLGFLTDIATDNRSVDVRKAAVYSIGNQEVARSVGILKGIIQDDENKEVQKAAIYSLGNNDTPQARQALLEMIEEMGRRSSS